MRIKMIEAIATMEQCFSVGQEFEVDDKLAQEFVDKGLAKFVATKGQVGHERIEKAKGKSVEEQAKADHANKGDHK